MKLSELVPGSSGFRAGMRPPWSACRASTALAFICAHPGQIDRALPRVTRPKADRGMGGGLGLSSREHSMRSLWPYLIHFEGEVLRRERLQARGLGDAGGPHDVAVAAADRQQRERPGGQEALPGGVVGVLRPHGGHNAALMVAPRKGA